MCVVLREYLLLSKFLSRIRPNSEQTSDISLSRFQMRNSKRKIGQLLFNVCKNKTSHKGIRYFILST